MLCFLSILLCWVFFVFNFHCVKFCQVGLLLCLASTLDWAEVVSARLNPSHSNRYVGGMCNFLGSVLQQQKFEMADCVTAWLQLNFIWKNKRLYTLEVWGWATPKGEVSVCLGFILLCVCHLSTFSPPYANCAGMFVSPEVLTLFRGFSSVLFSRAFPFLCLLVTAILDSFFLF